MAAKINDENDDVKDEYHMSKDGSISSSKTMKGNEQDKKNMDVNNEKDNVGVVDDDHDSDSEKDGNEDDRKPTTRMKKMMELERLKKN